MTTKKTYTAEFKRQAIELATREDVGPIGSGKLSTIGWESVSDRKPYRHRFPLRVLAS